MSLDRPLTYEELYGAGDAGEASTNGHKPAKRTGKTRKPAPGDGDVVDSDPWRHLPRPIDWATFWADVDTSDRCDWLVEPILPTGRQVAIFSAAKQGKSLIALEAGAAVASGRPILGQPARPALPVVYVDLEMTEADLRERLEDLGYGPGVDLSNLHYYQLPELPPLDKPAGGAVLERIVQRHQAALVVIDTMARAVDGEENDSDTYRDFYRHTGLRLKAAKVALLRLDHAGKNLERGQRGASSKAEDVDVVFLLTAEGRRVNLRRTHSRVSWVPEHVRLERSSDLPLEHRRLADNVWQAGTGDCAADLDRLGVPLDATVKAAQQALRDANLGRRTELVADALRFRKSRP